jgi:1-acyl-sn-glycerol-3-phosphate acyltransferase
MNASILVVLTLILLLFPRLLVAAPRSDRALPTTEFKGYLAILHWFMKQYCSTMYRFDCKQPAPLPNFGPAILISNHTCGIDHMLLQTASNRLLGFVVAKEYYESPLLNAFCKSAGCIPVNRDGHDVAAIRAALRALKEGRVVPIFPEGRITPASGERMGDIKFGSAYIAIRSRVPVIPAYILGTPLTDEIIPSLITRSRASVTFGQPIDLSDIDPRRAGDKTVQAQVCERFKQTFLALQAEAIAARDHARTNGEP